MTPTDLKAARLRLGFRSHRALAEAIGVKMTNEERAQRVEMAIAACAQRAEMAIAAYLAAYPVKEDLSATIVDLVTDLMHLAHQKNIEPDYVAHMSQEYYNAEMDLRRHG